MKQTFSTFCGDLGDATPQKSLKNGPLVYVVSNNRLKIQYSPRAYKFSISTQRRDGEGLTAHPT
jgi:hypothetical protein